MTDKCLHPPKRGLLASRLTEICGGLSAFPFASGGSSLATLMKLLDHGDHVIASEHVNSHIHTLFESVYRRTMGIEFSYLDLNDLDAVEAELRETTKLIWVESPSGPKPETVDLSALAARTKRPNLIRLADCTEFVGSGQTALESGFDSILYRSSAVFSGDRNLEGGAVIFAEGQEMLRDKFNFAYRAFGAAPTEHCCAAWLDGMTSLPDRHKAQEKSAGALARGLQEVAGVEQVSYPGEGCRVNIELDREGEAVHEVLAALKCFQRDDRAGSAVSTFSHPASGAYHSVPPEIRWELGVPDGLICLSIGVEEPEALLEDLKSALGA